MSIDLYLVSGSPPCRAVQLVAAALDLKLTVHTVDLQAGDHRKPEYLKLNPQHTVPTLVDSGFSIWESRAIARYLANKYGEKTTLYPKDPKQRALVDQRLDFDLGSLYSSFAQFFYPQLFTGAAPDPVLLQKFKDALGFLNTFLEGNKYAAGENLTIADLALVATVSTIDLAGFSLQEYPNIVRWYDLIKTTAPKYKEANEKGLIDLKERLAAMKLKAKTTA